MGMDDINRAEMELRRRDAQEADLARTRQEIREIRRQGGGIRPIVIVIGVVFAIVLFKENATNTQRSTSGGGRQSGAASQGASEPTYYIEHEDGLRLMMRYEDNGIRWMFLLLVIEPAGIADPVSVWAREFEESRDVPMPKDTRDWLARHLSVSRSTGDPFLDVIRRSIPELSTGDPWFDAIRGSVPKV